MDFIKILLVYDTVEKCEKTQNIFNKYRNIICDYDIYADINNIDYEYNVIIYEITNENEYMYIKHKSDDVIYVAYSSNLIDEQYIKKLMSNGFDMYFFNELNKETIHHMLCIYNLIIK